MLEVCLNLRPNLGILPSLKISCNYIFKFGCYEVDEDAFVDLKMHIQMMKKRPDNMIFISQCSAGYQTDGATMRITSPSVFDHLQFLIWFFYRLLKLFFCLRYVHSAVHNEYLFITYYLFQHCYSPRSILGTHQEAFSILFFCHN